MKTHSFILKSTFFLLLVLSLIACDKSKDGVAKININFEHFFKNDVFRVDTNTVYTLANGEELIFSRFQYYISNIQLRKSDGTGWSEAESYHIINARNDRPFAALKEVPEGEYNQIRFLIGVDSIRNFSGAQSGALSPSNEMFWSWNTGYIFLMSEGRCLQRPEANPFFIHHIGGFQGVNNAIRTVTLELDKALSARSDMTSDVNLKVETHRLYEGPSIMLSILETPSAHSPGENTRRMADNYAQMIREARVTN